MPDDFKMLFATMIAVSSSMNIGHVSDKVMSQEYSDITDFPEKKPNLTEICLYYDLYRELKR